MKLSQRARLLGAIAISPRMPGVEASNSERWSRCPGQDPRFVKPPFVVKGSYVQISPSGERCHAGEVTIKPDAHGQSPQISGELFTLRRAAP